VWAARCYSRFVEISSQVPNVDDLLGLEVEEVGWVLLVRLRGHPDVVRRGEIHQYNFFNALDQRPIYDRRQAEVRKALLEAWAWLEREGLLVRETSASGSGFFLSRRAMELENGADFNAYRRASRLPKSQLHSRIAVRVYPAFLRGEYDTAVFQAFREVEIAVREAGGFPADLVGVELMRQAFRVVNRPTQAAVAPGPLADVSLPVAEQEGMAHLFAGAIGIYKNPQSHRYVPTCAEEAAEVIMFASQLLRIVDRVTPPRS